MPFKKGAAAIRRTIGYLEKGRILLKDNVKIVTVNYNVRDDKSQGTKEFLFWHFPQIQYKNPGVQMVMMKNLTPSPFIKCYFDDGESVLIDTWGKDRFQIYEHLNQVVGKSRATLEAEAVAKQKKQNEANFGSSYSRQCICEIPGQVPCSAYSVQAKEEFSKLFPKGKTSVLV